MALRVTGLRLYDRTQRIVFVEGVGPVPLIPSLHLTYRRERNTPVHRAYTRCRRRYCKRLFHLREVSLYYQGCRPIVDWIMGRVTSSRDVWETLGGHLIHRYAKKPLEPDRHHVHRLLEGQNLLTHPGLLSLSIGSRDAWL